MYATEEVGTESPTNRPGRRFWRDVLVGLVGAAITATIMYILTLIPQVVPELPWLFFHYGITKISFDTNEERGEIYIIIDRNNNSPNATYYRVDWKTKTIARGIEDTASYEGLILNFVNESGAKDPVTVVTNGTLTKTKRNIHQIAGMGSSPFAHHDMPKEVLDLVSPHGTTQSKYKLISF